MQVCFQQALLYWYKQCHSIQAGGIWNGGMCSKYLLYQHNFFGDLRLMAVWHLTIVSLHLVTFQRV